MPHLSPQTLTQAEQRAIQRATAKNPRDHLLYSLALGTGLRLAEIVGLNVGDVYSPEGRPRNRVRLRREIAKGGRSGTSSCPKPWWTSFGDSGSSRPHGARGHSPRIRSSPRRAAHASPPGATSSPFRPGSRKPGSTGSTRSIPSGTPSSRTSTRPPGTCSSRSDSSDTCRRSRRRCTQIQATRRCGRG